MVYSALEGKEYECYMQPETTLPFAHVDDMISETVSSTASLFGNRPVQNASDHLQLRLFQH